MATTPAPDAPTTLDALKKLTGLAAVQGATAYIANGEEKVREARQFRDTALTTLADRVGLAKAAEQSGLSISTVRIARGRA